MDGEAEFRSEDMKGIEEEQQNAILSKPSLIPPNQTSVIHSHCTLLSSLALIIPYLNCYRDYLFLHLASGCHNLVFTLISLTAYFHSSLLVPPHL